jgi:2-oxoisovalerate dehydrogenase E2 component (dihydrolipoyl transacylase)
VRRARWTWASTCAGARQRPGRPHPARRPGRLAAGGGQRPAGSPYAERHGEEAIPVIGLRRKIAQKMQDAKRRIPHFSYVEEVDVTELEALRQQLNKIHGATRGKLTLLPFLVRAMVLALRDFPQINARYDDEAGVVTRHGAVHLGIATQTDGGLMVPVLRHAEAWTCGPAPPASPAWPRAHAAARPAATSCPARPSP